MEFTDLEAVLPHRSPILILDRVTDVAPGVSGTGWKELSASDPWFEGHFPNEPILPGVMALEACAQTALVVMRAGQAAATGGLGYLSKVDKASFYKPITPGMAVAFNVRITRKLGIFIMVDCLVEVDGVKMAKASLTLASPKLGS
jgi:3-hydroxyacyl-[acyl-carrier-protein] dehydratase